MRKISLLLLISTVLILKRLLMNEILTSHITQWRESLVQLCVIISSLNYHIYSSTQDEVLICLNSEQYFLMVTSTLLRLLRIKMHRLLLQLLILIIKTVDDIRKVVTITHTINDLKKVITTRVEMMIHMINHILHLMMFHLRKCLMINSLAH